MEDQEDHIFSNHFLDLNCETDYSNASFNDSDSVVSNKNTYDFSYVQENLPTSDALGYLAIDKFVLGIILDAKTAAKTRLKESLDNANIYNEDGTFNASEGKLVGRVWVPKEGGKFNEEGKVLWATKQKRENRNFFLSHNLEVKEAVPCVNLCGFKSSNKKKLQCHMNNCLMSEEEKPFTCPECGQKSAIDKDHHDHLMKHVIQTPFKCFYCDKLCKSKGYFREHFLSEHKAVKSYCCTRCSFSTVKRQCLVSHMASHLTKRSEKCNLCGDKFKDYVGLKLHMRTHIARDMGNNPQIQMSPQTVDNPKIQMPTKTADNLYKVKRSFTCNLCGQKYKQKAALQRHLYSHQDKQLGESINPLKCSMCLFSCKQGAKLQRHMINLHPESVDLQSDGSIGKRPYACTVCEMTFIRASDLQNHMKCHMKTVKQVVDPVVVETKNFPFFQIVNEDMPNNDE